MNIDIKLLQKLYKSFNLIPLSGKIPTCKWADYRDKKIEFSRLQNAKNVGIITGLPHPEHPEYRLEVIDIDNHFGDADELYNFIIDNCMFDDILSVQKTGGGGYHIFFYSKQAEGNQKLALRKNNKGKWEALIETRGIGGYVVFYNNPIKNDLFSIPLLTKEQREILFEIAKSQNEKYTNFVDNIEETKTKKYNNFDTTQKPGDIYNNDPNSIAEAKQLLRQAGWTEVSNRYWRRPNKKIGWSAMFNDTNLYVFSSNADPFESETAYTPFAILTKLKFNGDFSASAKFLAEKYNLLPKKTQKIVKTSELDEPTNKNWQALFDIIKKWDLKFRYNEISRVLEVRRGENGAYQDETKLLLGDIVYEMENFYGIKRISKNKISEMIYSSKISKKYNPFKNFIQKIKRHKADPNKDYIGELVKYIELQDDEEPIFFYKMFKKHLIRTYRSIIEPKYINRLVLVFYGEQEIGKSRLWEWLTPDELYSDEPINLSDKDTYLALSKYLFINFDDLDQLAKKEVAKLKAFISKGELNKRLPYGHTEIRMPRMASFVGTTNLYDILADEKNTRWIFLKVKNFDWQKYTSEIHPLDIWSQIRRIYEADNNAGELTKDEKYMRDLRNSNDFLENTTERELLMSKFFATENKNYLTATDVYILLTKNYYGLKINRKQLERELHRLFGKPERRTVRGRQGRYYQIDYDLPIRLDIDNPTEFINNYYETDKDDVPF